MKDFLLLFLQSLSIAFISLSISFFFLHDSVLQSTNKCFLCLILCCNFSWFTCLVFCLHIRQKLLSSFSTLAPMSDFLLKSHDRYVRVEMTESGMRQNHGSEIESFVSAPDRARTLSARKSDRVQSNNVKNLKKDRKVTRKEKVVHDMNTVVDGAAKSPNDIEPPRRVQNRKILKEKHSSLFRTSSEPEEKVQYSHTSTTLNSSSTYSSKDMEKV